ncbi:MAG: SUMF1/EgtB/PvdO family nonheme iron enzyme [Thiotrichaceae bacterium]|nr:SUMF1/EgtB/PvdO family nonheme iron enzyme [Thiotrichaceae bacterium]PCI14799.1 MAG: serine/threonine protein kinase [Thiotrichales bacterium]
MNKLNIQTPLSEEQRQVRKRYIGATFVTCIVLSLVGGTIHVLELGSNRMHDMRDKAGINLDDEHDHIRAAGEELFRQVDFEFGDDQQASYTVEEAAALLTPEQWADVDQTILIPAGEFLMGTDRRQSNVYNRPQHTASTDEYRIDKYAVTNAQYARFIAATAHRPPLDWKDGKIGEGKELHPVTMVSWQNAADYAAWAGKRLPTEVEWEKAARGTEGLRWPWGNVMDAERLNTYYSVGSTTLYNAYPEGAGPYGVMDMVGNVSEWTADDFTAYTGSAAPANLFKAKRAKEPRLGPAKAMKMAEFVETDLPYKVLRGGSWKSDPFSTATYHRNYAWPNFASDFFGFRCAQTP